MISGETKAGLNGLVLAGGKSLRMGADKTLMQWHGKEQRYHMADLLAKVCGDVFISCRDEEQAQSTANNYKTLVDVYTGIGPYGGILTALEAEPGKAWLVVASDLPLLDEATLAYLIANREENAIATTYKSPHDGLPEPLITIWEPKAYALLQELRAEGMKCPRKALLRKPGEVKIIEPENPEALLNANTPKDAEKVNGILHGR